MHQPQSTVFSSVLIGSESLLVGCGEVLLDHGFPIAMVVTDNDEIAAWAQGRGLPMADLDTDLPAKLAEMRFEWLFSIANLRIIPDAVLAQAANGAINFHDGPLPAYGADPASNQVGVVERIGDFRWRMVMPGAQGQAKLDVLELLPDAPAPKA